MVKRCVDGGAVDGGALMEHGGAIQMEHGGEIQTEHALMEVR